MRCGSLHGLLRDSISVPWEVFHHLVGCAIKKDHGGEGSLSMRPDVLGERWH